jgi:hypothetical protein
VGVSLVNYIYCEKPTTWKCPKKIVLPWSHGRSNTLTKRLRFSMRDLKTSSWSSFILTHFITAAHFPTHVPPRLLLEIEILEGLVYRLNSKI